MFGGGGEFDLAAEDGDGGGWQLDGSVRVGVESRAGDGAVGVGGQCGRMPLVLAFAEGFHGHLTGEETGSGWRAIVEGNFHVVCVFLIFVDD